MATPQPSPRCGTTNPSGAKLPSATTATCTASRSRTESVARPEHGGKVGRHPGRGGRREFCGACGTGLFYRNEEALPGIVDIQSGTLDDANAHPAGAHIMVKERLDWTRDIAALSEFRTYPGLD